MKTEFFKKLSVIHLFGILFFVFALTECNPGPTISKAIITDTPIQMPTITSSPTQLSTATSIPLPTNTATVAATVTFTPEVKKGYDFETGTEGWTTSEGQYKLAALTVSKTAYTGNQSLELDTLLVGNGNSDFSTKYKSQDVYRHTEAVGYFSQPPQGFDSSGPYDLTGKQLSCYVFLPPGLATDKNTAYVRLILKDNKFANIFSEGVDVTPPNTNKWIKLSLIDQKSSDSDFDPTRTNAMGVRIDTHDEFPLDFTGSIFIDDCTIE